MFLRKAALTRVRSIASWIAVFFGLSIAIFAVAGTVWAVESSSQNASQRQYISAPPSGEKYRVMVIGDSLGNGVWRGLNEAFRGERNIQIERRSRVSTGLVRDDYYNWPVALEGILKEKPIQVAIVLFGTNDKQAISVNRGRYRVGSPEWQREYRARVDRVMQLLSGRGIAVYWVGLPIMRSSSFAAHAARVNDIVSASAARYGIRFVETWNEFADDRGQYSAFGPDITGRTRRLRMDDGIHFTGPGDRMLARTVERILRVDLVGASENTNTERMRGSIMPSPERRTGGLTGALALLNGAVASDPN